MEFFARKRTDLQTTMILAPLSEYGSAPVSMLRVNDRNSKERCRMFYNTDDLARGDNWPDLSERSLGLKHRTDRLLFDTPTSQDGCLVSQSSHVGRLDSQ